MSDYEKLKAYLRDLDWAEVDAIAKQKKLPSGTLYKIAIGKTKNPGVKTVERFVKALSL